MERIDWTKYVVPRTVANQIDDPNAFNSEAFRTTDLVTIPSLEDYQNQKNFSRVKATTDFTACFGCQGTGRNGAKGWYWLRDIGLVTDGVSVYNHVRVWRGIGLSPSISLKLPERYTLNQLAQQLDLTKKKIGFGKSYYQVTLGEYPQSEISPDIEKVLEERYHGQVADDHFRCTGRLYTVNGLTRSSSGFVTVQKPEYEYHGERYVRVNRTNWYKVEPITWVVKNFKEVASGKAKQIDLDCTKIIVAGVPFQRVMYDTNATMWQNSLVRAYLNGADSRQLDGNPNYHVDGYDWDFTQGGFLQQALNLTRETRVYIVPECEDQIGEKAFAGCRSLEKIIVPAHVNTIHVGAFDECDHAQVMLDITNPNRGYNLTSLSENKVFQYIYLPKTTQGKWLVFSPYVDANLENDYQRVDYNYANLSKYLEYNYLHNYIQLQEWKANHKIKFIPPEFTLQVFPTSEIKNYFLNNNHKRWAELVQALHFDLLQDQQRTNTLTDLMKIYYALGGFSQHQGERDKAFNYLVQHYAEVENKQFDENKTALDKASQIGNDIHANFSRLELKGPHHPTFAKFFMKYFHANPAFMKFDLCGDGEHDYLCAAHNSFDEILKNYPNRVVNGNTERNLLTPEFVAKHCVDVKYKNVDEGNQGLAAIVGQYAYSPEQFDTIQKIYNQAKQLGDNYVIRADRSIEENGVSFRVLKKDDPLGFVIGDITNCCQHIGGAGDSCVRDGYTNPNAGFLIFEESLRDQDGNPTGEKRLLAQAYVWYDPQTETVCYDNIELPKKVARQIQVNKLTKSIINSADEIMTTMNQRGTKVKRVTVGMGYNDMYNELVKNFKSTHKLAKHRSYSGYTDANKEQYLIRTYEETTARLANGIMDTAQQIMQSKSTQSGVAREL